MLVWGLVRVARLCVKLVVAHCFLCCCMRVGLHEAVIASEREVRNPTVIERNCVALSSLFALS